MTSTKIVAGAIFPEIRVHSLDGESVDLGTRDAEDNWKLVVVYRGTHCPLCTKYLNQLEGHRQALRDINIELVAVSADSKAQLEDHKQRLEVSFPLYYGLTIAQMQQLGLYISHPRSPQETDHPFPEPGVFVINSEGRVQVADISNNPFVRPAIDQMVDGLEWIRNPNNNYPIRGTFAYS